MQPTPDEPQKPITPDEVHGFDVALRIVAIVGLCVCVFIYIGHDKTPPVWIFGIFGAGIIGTDNFLKILDKIRPGK